MNTKHSDLIAIANADLAEKLTRSRARQQSSANKDKPQLKSVSNDEAETKVAAETTDPRSFQNDAWRAVYTLNIMRYALGLLLLILVTASAIDSNWAVFNELLHPKIFFFSALTVLASAIVFSYLSKNRDLDFNLLVGVQFTLDVILAGFLTHSTGSVASNFVILYMVVVGTGSVVLPRKHALALASGAIIVLFYEHMHSIWSQHVDISAQYSLLATYSILLMASSLLIAYLAERIRIAELKTFVPGNESIEDYLVREEVTALKTALDTTEGNKTEAAKLLGMSFRSFRYKLTKYDID